MAENVIFPDITWYETISKRRKMQEHCPYADLYKCPRFWITQEKLDSIKLDSYEKEELIKFWDNEQYINLTSEQKPRVEFQGPDKPLYYSNLCPEAANRVL